MKMLTSLLRQKLQIVLVLIGIAGIPCVVFGIEPIATIGQPPPEAHAFLTNNTILRVVPTHIQVVDIDTGKVIDEFGERTSLSDVVFSPTGSHVALLKYSRDTNKTTVNIWDANTRERIDAREIERRFSHNAAFSPTQPIFALPIAREIHLWNWQNGEIDGKLIRENMSTGEAMVFTPDGNHLIISTLQPGIEIWDVETRQLQGRYEEQIAHRLDNLAISPDGTTLAAFKENSIKNLTIYVWDVETKRLLWREKSGIGRISDAVFSPDSQRLYVSSWTGALQRSGPTSWEGWDDKVRVWDVKSGQQLDTFGTKFHDLETITLSPDEKTVLLQYPQGVVLWDIARKKPLSVWADFVGRWGAIGDLSPDGKTVVTGSRNLMKTWDVASQQLRLLIFADDYMFEGFAISPDSQKIVVSKDPWFELYDLQTGKIEMQFPQYVPGAYEIAFSPSGRWIAGVDVWSDLIILDTKNPGKKHRLTLGLPADRHSCYRFVFSKDETYLAASSRTGQNNSYKYWVLLWKLERDTFTFQYAWQVSELLDSSLAFTTSPDGSTVLAGSDGEKVRIWQILPGGTILLKTLNAEGSRPFSSVGSMQFSPDGRYLFVNQDERFRIWDWQKNRPINHASLPHFSALSQDGSVLLSPNYITEQYEIWDIGNVLSLLPYSVEPGGKQLVTLGQLKRNELLQNFPNPFNPETWIPFRLANEGLVTIHIYTPAGKLVRTLSPGLTPAGEHASQAKAVHWDGRNDAGEQVSSGVYLYTINAGDFSDTRKMLIKK